MKPATFQIGNQNNTNEKEQRNTNEKQEQNNIYSIKPLKVAENVYYLQK
jgi:hypothetical protein